MIDSRFLSLDTRIDGILEGDSTYNTVSTSRIADGERYLVLGEDTEYQYHNCIVSNNNGTLSAVPARKGMPPVIDNRGNILSYNGTSWEGIGHVGAIMVDDIIDFICVDTDSSSVKSKFRNKAGVKFLQTLDVYNGVAGILVSTGNDVTCVISTKGTASSYKDIVNVGFWYLANNEDGKVYYTMPFSTSSTDGQVPIAIEVGVGTVVIHKATGRAYTYNSTAHKWVQASDISVRHVDNVVDLNYTSSSYDSDIAPAGVKFISTNSVGGYNGYTIYTSNGQGGTTNNLVLSGSEGLNPDEYWVADMNGYLYYYISGASACIECGKVDENELIISKVDYSMYRFDDTINAPNGGLVKLGGNSSSSGSSTVATGSGITNEVFTLSASNISNKSITLSSSVASGKTDSVLVFLGGAVHTAGTDFSVSGSTISWNGLALDTAGLKQSDKLVVQYMPA